MAVKKNSDFLFDAEDATFVFAPQVVAASPPEANNPLPNAVADMTGDIPARSAGPGPDPHSEPTAFQTPSTVVLDLVGVQQDQYLDVPI